MKRKQKFCLMSVRQVRIVVKNQSPKSKVLLVLTVMPEHWKILNHFTFQPPILFNPLMPTNPFGGQ